MIARFEKTMEYSHFARKQDTPKRHPQHWRETCLPHLVVAVLGLVEPRTMLAICRMRHCDGVQVPVRRPDDRARSFKGIHLVKKIVVEPDAYT